MTEPVQLRIIGGGWVTSAGWGRMRDGRPVELREGPPVIPAPAEIFSRRLPRWGRYDEYTKCGMIAAGLALSDAGEDEGEERRAIGIVSSSAGDCVATDLAYYRTTLEKGGALASPNLFSYTLPGIMLGECAILFQLDGPTLCVGEAGGLGMAALRTAALLLTGSEATAMLAGWTECLDPETRALASLDEGVARYSGSAFVLLSARPPEKIQRVLIGGTAAPGCDSIVIENETITCAGRGVESLLDLFAH